MTSLSQKSLIIPPLGFNNNNNIHNSISLSSDAENITPQDSSRTNLSKFSKDGQKFYLQIPDFDDERDKSISQRTPKSFKSPAANGDSNDHNNHNHQQKSINTVINQRDQFNQKIEKRRQEKMRIARLKAIDDLAKTKAQKEIDAKLAEELNKLKTGSVKSGHKSKKNSKVQSNNKTPRNTNANKSRTVSQNFTEDGSTITQVSRDLLQTIISQKNEDKISSVSHAKSETLDAILDSLREIEDKANQEIVTTQKNTEKNVIAHAYNNDHSPKPVKINKNRSRPISPPSQVASKINSIMSYLEDIENNTEIMAPKVQQNVDKKTHKS